MSVYYINFKKNLSPKIKIFSASKDSVRHCEMCVFGEKANLEPYDRGFKRHALKGFKSV